MKILTTMRAVPPMAVGHVRDLRVRWALEEAGTPYQVRLIGPEDQVSPAYRRQQPFGKVPLLQDGDVTLFESGAILLYLGAQSPALLPADEHGRAQASSWMFAAMNTIEPPVLNLVQALFFANGEAWATERRPALEAAVVDNLRDLDTWLQNRDYLTGRFTVADILMTTVLRMLGRTGLMEPLAALSVYHARCKARPAFRKALAEQIAVYAQETAPA